MSIAIVPYGTKPGLSLSRVPLASLNWPLGAPGDLSGTVGDLTENDDLIVYPKSAIYYMPWIGVRCRMSVMIVEPEAVHSRHMKMLRLFYWRFHRILTCNPALKSSIPNAVHYVFGSAWVRDVDAPDRPKTKSLSHIASSKTTYEGHRLRHEVAIWLREAGVDADVIGRGYQAFERKSDGLAPYRYSIVVENVRETSYFTEKLIDCLLCNTVPIYWGAPDIGDYFDTSGMLICNNLDDIKAAVAGLSEADYDKRRAAILRNRERAAQYADHEQNAARLLQTGRMLSGEVA